MFHDFKWVDVFPDERTHFRHGQKLAEGVQRRCPEGLVAALLLTRRTDVEQGLVTTPTHFLYVLNIDEWLSAEDDFALAYLATHLAVEPENLGRFANLSLIGDPAAVAQFLEQELSVDLVAEWLRQDDGRLERLASIVDFRAAAPTDVQQALDAISAIGDLDRPQLKQLVDFVTRLTDPEQRADLIRGATADQLGRETAAVVLHERVAERVADARRHLNAYRSLLNNPGASETDMQEFLATHPLLFGLEYASIRPQQPGPSGSMDFLLERFDGYNDVVELKGPNEHILRSSEQEPGAGVPTPHKYRLGKELAHALPQALAYRDRLSRHPSAAEEFHGIRNAREPRLLIVLGRQSDLAEHERLVLLELNRSLHRAAVLPYDVIAQRAEATLANITAHLGIDPGPDQDRE